MPSAGVTMDSNYLFVLGCREDFPTRYGLEYKGEEK
jgi:hypothetical protein